MREPRDLPDEMKPDDAEDSRGRGAFSRIEQVFEADVAEAKAVAPLVAEAGQVTSVLRRQLKRWVPVLAIAALAAALVFSGAYRELNLANLARYHDVLQGWAGAHPLLSSVALVLAVATIVSTGLPGGLVFTIGAGLFFGTVLGALLAATGDTIGAFVLFLTARQFFATGKTPPPLVEKIRAGFNAHPVSFAFFVRLVPVFPFGATSVALAWLGCRVPLFLASSTLGVLPATLIYAALGSGLSKTISEHHDVDLSVLASPRFAVPLVALAVLALVPALVGLSRRTLRQSSPPN